MLQTLDPLGMKVVMVERNRRLDSSPHLAVTTIL